MSWSVTGEKGPAKSAVRRLREAFIKETPAPNAGHEAQFDAACHAISTVLPTLAPGGEGDVTVRASGHVGTGASLSIYVQA